MPTTWNIAGQDAGIGVSTPPPQPEQTQTITNASFKTGLFLASSPENQPKDSLVDMLDVRVDADDSLRRLEGITQNELVLAHNLRYIFQQATLDYSTELVVIDPPYIGHKAGGVFTWNNLGITATGEKGWNVATVAGTLMFSNGLDSTYTREPGASTVTDISADIIADTMTTQFGRVFAGSITDPISGYQGLMLKWNGTEADPTTDWDSLNAGAELLIADDLEADRIIALRALGFDLLVILTRKSVWVAARTNAANRPADPRLRFPGFGCVAEPTAVVTPHGVAYLSDQGVIVCDGNNTSIVSGVINSRLLPINDLQLSSYAMVYQSGMDRLVFQTPFGILYYEFENEGRPARWYQSSFVSDSLVLYVNQSGDVTWDAIRGAWNQQILTWEDVVQASLTAPALLYFTKGHQLGYEDSTAEANMGSFQNPYVVVPEDLSIPSDQISTIMFEIEYATDGVLTQVVFQTTDYNGDLSFEKTIQLPNTHGSRRVGIFGFTGTGMGTQMGIRFTIGSANISRVTRTVISAGPMQQVLG